MTSTALPVRRRARRVLPLLGLAALATLAFSAAIGSVGLGARELVDALAVLLGGGSDTLASTLLSLRLARAAAGFVTGATLALAGAMMQALLRNPLADPFVLGVSGGAAVGALAAIFFIGAGWWVNGAAFAGALAVALLLLVLARRDLRGGLVQGATPLLILTGVIVSSGCGALIALLLAMAPDGRLRGMVFWMIGDLSGASFTWAAALMLGAVLAYVLRHANAINLLAMHADGAAALGVRVGPLRRGLFVGSALLTACAVSNAGSVGFVGLIVPHACRFWLGPDHRLLLPAAALCGGAFLVLADALARTVMAPAQLPVGVITSLIGVPLFLLQLHQVGKR